MIRGIQKILLIGVLCFVLFGCNLLVKELHLSVPPQIAAEDPTFTTPTEWAATVSTAYPVPNPYDGTSADLTVQLDASGLGADNLILNPGNFNIEKGGSVGEFFVSAIYDGVTAPNEEVTITARAIGYDEDSATITIIFP
jgi:hypothetical protein